MFLAPRMMRSIHCHFYSSQNQKYNKYSAATNNSHYIIPYAQQIPTIIVQKIYAVSLESLIAVRNLTMESAPTIPVKALCYCR